MFVIAYRLNIPKVEDSRIRKFLSLRRKDAKFGIFILLTWREIIRFLCLAVFASLARDIPMFGCGLTALALISSPVAAWVLLCFGPKKIIDKEIWKTTARRIAQNIHPSHCRSITVGWF
jgi:hypothetical protein